MTSLSDFEINTAKELGRACDQQERELIQRCIRSGAKTTERFMP